MIDEDLDFDPPTFGQRIEKARLDAGLTKLGLGKAVGVSATCVWNWEKKNRTPDKQTLVKLPAALGVSLEYLMTGKTKKTVDAPKTIDETLRWAEKNISKIVGTSLSNVKVSVRII